MHLKPGLDSVSEELEIKNLVAPRTFSLSVNYFIIYSFLFAYHSFFLGASKSGTTSLAHHLQTHPMILNINAKDEHTKEGHWFDSRRVELMDEAQTAKYIDSFDGKYLIRGMVYKQPGFNSTENRPLVMDYTPNYLVCDETPILIRKAFPQIADRLKFMVLLRDPTARTLSSWKAKRGKHGKSIPDLRNVTRSGILQGECIAKCFNEYFDGPRLLPAVRRSLWEVANRTAEDSLNPLDCSIKQCRKQVDGNNGRSGGIATLAHVVKSMYAYQLLHWFMVFHPSQFLILTLEEFTAEPLVSMERIITFLGLSMYDDRTSTDDARIGWKSKEYLLRILKRVKNRTKENEEVNAQITSELIEELRTFFRPHNQRLNDILERSTRYQ